MAKNVSTARYSVVTRCLAALALMFVYVVGTSGLLLTASTTSAEAQWGRGRGRGWSRGRGRGIFVAPIVTPIVRGRGCHYSPRWGRVICPY